MRRAPLILIAVLLALPMSALPTSALPMSALPTSAPAMVGLLHGEPALARAAESVASTQPVAVDVAEVTGRQIVLRMPLESGATPGSGAIGASELQIDGRTIKSQASLQAPSSTEVPQPTLAMMVLDASGSMDGDRIRAARAAASAFVQDAPPGVAVGLVAFDDQARLALAPTVDRQAALTAIADVQAGGDTALYDAIQLGVAAIPPADTARVILLSDGADTSSDTRLAAALRAARDRGVPIDVIAIQPTDDEQAILARIAAVNDGRLLTADNADELASAFMAAGESFAATVMVRAAIPETIDARSAPFLVRVEVDGIAYLGSGVLPDDPALAASLARPAPAALAPTDARSAWYVMGAIGFLAVLAAGIAWILADHRIRRRRRVEQLSAYQLGPARPAASLTSLGWLDGLLEHMGRARAMRAALAAAEIPVSPGAWLLIRIGISLLLAAIGGLTLGPIVGGLVGLVLGWLLTWIWVKARSSRRQQSFADQLPDFLLLLASGLRGGLSFNHALEAAAVEGRGEVPRQMRRVLREVQVGTLLDDALMECADRMDNEDLRWTVTALSIQREVGGNLSTILDTAAATIKSREELRREVRTLSAEGRLSGYILIGLPLGVMAFLAIIRRPYVELLWTTSLGIVMLSIMGALMVGGWFWMRAIVRIKA